MSEQAKESPPEISLQSLLAAIQKAPDTKSIKGMLHKYILAVFNVEVAAIFLANIPEKKLVSWLLLPGEVLENIELPIETNSIAGYVAKKKQTVVLRDPYDFQELRRVGPELSFSNTYDEKANMRSKQILAVPIVADNALVGVVELINKKDNNDFTHKDQNALTALAKVLAPALFTKNSSGRQTPTKYDSLLEHKLISQKDLEQGLAQAAESGEDPETVLLNTFQLPRQEMGKLLAKFYSTSFVELGKVDNDPKKLFRGIDIDYFEKEELVPLSMIDGKFVVAVKNIEDQTLADTIPEHVPRVNQVELVLAFQEDIRAYWKRTKAKYANASNDPPKERLSSIDTSLFDLLDDDTPQERIVAPRVARRIAEERLPPRNAQSSDHPVEKKPREQVVAKPVASVERSVLPEKHVENNDNINTPQVVQLVNEIIEFGYTSQASDIHIEPYGLEENGEVRYRIDGVCRNALKIPQQYVRQVVARIKSLASLARAERAKPQDGIINFTTSGGKEIELRVATIPTANDNEDIVLRVLPAPKPLPVLDQLMPSRILGQFQEIIEQQKGLILVVGPEVSGKTTTLHSILNHVNTTEKKIWTAEYPVEIRQHRIRQMQIDPLTDYTFAAALKTLLRADPDVIMVGDMQDLQTAVLAVDATQSGNLLLLSSLPAISAAEGIVQCLGMGLDPSRLAAALNGVMAQRLVRTLCEHCKKPYHPERAEYDRLLESYGISFFEHINIMYSDDLVFYRADGCSRCNNSGYLGKVGLYELLVVDSIIKNLIVRRAPLGEIIEEALGNGMSLLEQEGIQLVFAGIIDCKELTSVCSL